MTRLYTARSRSFADLVLDVLREEPCVPAANIEHHAKGRR